MQVSCLHPLVDGNHPTERFASSSSTSLLSDFFFPEKICNTRFQFSQTMRCKRLFSLLFALVCFFALATQAQANTVTVADVYTQTVGVVSVPITITGNSNVVTAVNIQLNYDATLASVTVADIYAGASIAGWISNITISPPIPNSTLKTVQLTFYDPYGVGVSGATLSIADMRFTLPGTLATVPLTLAPGARLFGMGQTDISAQYTLKHGSINIGTAPLADNLAPVVTAPASVSVAAQNANGTPATDAAISAFLNSATATDNVGVVGAITNNAPAIFPVGMTTVTFSASDAAGNTGTATADVTILPFTASTTSYNPAFLGTDAAGPVLTTVDQYGNATSNAIGFFNASVTVLGSTPIDVNGDGVREFAVVAQRTDNLIMCQVRDVYGTLIRAFYVTNANQASVLNVFAAQTDPYAGEELVVGKIKLLNNQPVVTVYNPATGAVKMETFMLNPNWTAQNFFALDANGDGIDEIALAGIKNNGLAPTFIPVNRPAVQIRNGVGAIYGYVFPLDKAHTNVTMARIDTNGDGVDEIVSMGTNFNNRLVVSVSTVNNVTWSYKPYLDQSVSVGQLLVGDVDGVPGDEVVLGATLVSNGRPVVDVRDPITNARKRLLYMQNATFTPTQYALTDWNGDGVQDVMVQADNGAGTTNYMVRDNSNALLYNGTPVGISGVGVRYAGQ